MKNLNHLSFSLVLMVCLAIGVHSQTKPNEGFGGIELGSVENGVFRSIAGKFSIAIPDLPRRTIDKATEKAKAKGVDVGKQFLWRFEHTLYTIYYTPPVDFDGNPSPQLYADIESGTRKSLLNSSTLISEKPITLGKYRGTEFRSVLPNGVLYVTRTYLVSDRGYQLMAGYTGKEYESEVLKVLDSFKPVEAK